MSLVERVLEYEILVHTIVQEVCYGKHQHYEVGWKQRRECNVTHELEAAVCNRRMHKSSHAMGNKKTEILKLQKV